MKVTFLGTGTSQGVPIIGCRCRVCTSADPKDNRLRSAVMVQVNGKNIVVDSGPDFRQQMLNTGIQRLDGLLITHAHKDHIAGLDDIRGFNFIQKEAIDVYCSEQVEAQIRREFAYIFSEHRYPGIPELHIHNIHNDVDFEVAGIPVTPIEVLHYKLPVTAFRFDRFAYVTDANYIAPKELEKLKGCDTLVLNALRQEEHISHFNLVQAIEIIKAINPRQAFITHISHQMGLHEEVNRSLPQGIQLAYDQLTIEL